MRRIPLGITILAAALSAAAHAQTANTAYSDAFEARRDRTQPALAYTIRVDPADVSGYSVELRVRNAPDTLRLAMPVWAPGAYRVASFARNVRGLTVTSGGRAAPVARDDSSSWRAVVTGGEATVRYRVVYPNALAGSSPNNRNFLTRTGGLLDGPATYVYPLDAKRAPAHVRLDVPAGWRIATGLVPTADPRTFFAPSIDVLLDSPVLLGALRVWTFDVDGVPHRVAYWPRPDAAPFDTAAFVQVTGRAVRTARDIFGELPYREYTFLFVDGTGGGLEHLNSTTIGAPSAALARDPASRASVTAHEFFHLWNVKRLRPAALGPFDYQRPVRTTGLWFSEGVTDFFADEILRRARIDDEAAAVRTLASNISSYLNNPAASRVSAERSSWTAWDPPAANEGYSISYYLQGLLIGEMLELRLRDATGGARGMDDVVRLMYDRHAGARGFTGEDILNTVNDACGCDLQEFFQAHVSGARPLDFARHLALAGWRLDTATAPAADSAGRPLPDLRASVTAFGGIGSAGGAAGFRPRLSVSDPTGAWARAGLLTGDELVSVNGRPVAGTEDFRLATAGARVGDTMRVVYVRGGAQRSATVPLVGYRTTRVRIVDLPNPTARQRAVRQAWLEGPTPR